MNPTELEEALAVDSAVRVRNLRPADFDDVVAIDAKSVGRCREEYFRIQLAENLSATGIRVSLAERF